MRAPTHAAINRFVCHDNRWKIRLFGLYPNLICLGIALILAVNSHAFGLGGAGTWTFKNPLRSHKAVVIGASISAYPKGNYAAFLEASCANLEVINKAQEKLGAHQLRDLFRRQVIDNQSLKADWPQNFWLIYHGGLNSVGAPYETNLAINETFQLAHQHNLKVIALSLLPWGSEKDSRWQGARGLKTKWQTQLVVDFVMGRLSPISENNSSSAFGGRRPQQKDAPLSVAAAAIKVDLYNSELRALENPLRASDNLAQQVAKDAWLQSTNLDLGNNETLADTVLAARAIPKFFMKKSLQSFDHIHPNTDGHRIIAQKTCPQLPPEFGCQCDKLPQLVWQKGKLVESLK